jgi:hypothetical protein
MTSRAIFSSLFSWRGDLEILFAAVGFERAAGFAAPGSRLIFPLMAPAGLLPVFAFTV